MKKMISSLLMVILLVTQLGSIQGLAVVHAATGVTQLENVIVSGGNFDTGIYINQNYSIEMTFSLSTLNQYKNLYYAAVGTGNSVYMLRNEASSGLYAKHGWYNAKIYKPAANQEVTVLQKKNVVYVNNKQILKASVQNLTATGTLKFGDFVGSIKSFQVWNESNVLVGHFVPVLDNDKKACMYNKVNGKCYYYSGTCKAGEIIETVETPEVSESIENSGSAEIETETETEKETTAPELEDNKETTIAVNYAEGLTVSGGNFNSGKVINQNYSTEMTFSLSTLNQYKNLYYASVDSKNYVYALRLEASNGLYMKHGWYNSKIYTPKTDEEITVLQKKNIFYVNGNQKLKATLQTLKAGYTLKFGDFAGTIKSFKLWDENGELVADYRPALDDSNKACMYDNVSKNYVYYSGTCKAILKETEKETVESSTESIAEDSIQTEEETVENTTENNTEEPTQVEEETVESTTEESVEIETETGNVTVETESDENNDTADVSKKTIEDELYDMLISGDMGSRDVSSYKVTVTEFYNMWAKFKEEEYVLYNNGYNIYPEAKFSGGYASVCKFVNMDSNFAQRYQRTIASIDKFMANVDDKMGDLDKILWAHEFIVQNTLYKDTGNIAHTAGGALGDGQCVCEGYAEAMTVLLKKAGVESILITSSKMNHGWTYVNLDGEWYHIDATWDDTKKGANEKYIHRYLMRNDSEFKALSHYGWICTDSAYGTVSASTKYTNWFVHDVAGTMHYNNGLWYYYDIDSNSIICSDVLGTSKTVVIDGSDMDANIILNGIVSNKLTYTINGTTYTKAL